MRADVKITVTQDVHDPRSLPATTEASKVVGFRHRAIQATQWLALLLVIVLGLDRELVGIFHVDLVATTFGAMTAVARTVYVLLGVAALYCAISTIVSAWGRLRRSRATW